MLRIVTKTVPVIAYGSMCIARHSPMGSDDLIVFQAESGGNRQQLLLCHNILNWCQALYKKKMQKNIHYYSR